MLLYVLFFYQLTPWKHQLSCYYDAFNRPVYSLSFHVVFWFVAGVTLWEFGHKFQTQAVFVRQSYPSAISGRVSQWDRGHCFRLTSKDFTTFLSRLSICNEIAQYIVSSSWKLLSFAMWAITFPLFPSSLNLFEQTTSTGHYFIIYHLSLGDLFKTVYIFWQGFYWLNTKSLAKLYCQTQISWQALQHLLASVTHKKPSGERRKMIFQNICCLGAMKKLFEIQRLVLT